MSNLSNLSDAELKRSVKFAVEVTIILGQAIREAGARGIPSGHIYAQVMEKVDLEVYNAAIRLLKDKGLVSETNFLLTWIAG